MAPSEGLRQMSKFYRNPTTILLENGAFPKIADWVHLVGAKKILLVLGGKFFKGSSYFGVLKEALRGLDWQVSTPVSENPKISFVREFSEKFRGASFDCVIGIGGGSAIDTAKMAAVILAGDAATLDDYIVSKKAFKKRLPLAAVPTTAGTGSEVTPYVSLSTQDRKKITVTDPQLFPDLALLDPLLTHTMPAPVSASTGMDALSQAIESFWSVHHTGLSDTHALRAVSLVTRHLETVVAKPGDAQARFAMALGSCESGLAIAQTATTAVHSVSYPITEHFGVPHGHACALTLAEFIRFNEPSMQDSRYDSLWKAMGVSSAFGAAEFVEGLMGKIGLERRLSKLGIDRKGMGVVLQNGFRPDRVKNNPRELTTEALKSMLMRIL